MRSVSVNAHARSLERGCLISHSRFSYLFTVGESQDSSNGLQYKHHNHQHYILERREIQEMVIQNKIQTQETNFFSTETKK